MRTHSELEGGERVYVVERFTHMCVLAHLLGGGWEHVKARVTGIQERMPFRVESLIVICNELNELDVLIIIWSPALPQSQLCHSLTSRNPSVAYSLVVDGSRIGSPTCRSQAEMLAFSIHQSLSMGFLIPDSGMPT